LQLSFPHRARAAWASSPVRIICRFDTRRAFSKLICSATACCSNSHSTWATYRERSSSRSVWSAPGLPALSYTEGPPKSGSKLLHLTRIFHSAEDGGGALPIAPLGAPLFIATRAARVEQLRSGPSNSTGSGGPSHAAPTGLTAVSFGRCYKHGAPTGA
jgi:hypothetical protein